MLVNKNWVAVLVLVAVLIGSPQVVSEVCATKSDRVVFYEVRQHDWIVSPPKEAGVNEFRVLGTSGIMSGDISGGYESVWYGLQHGFAVSDKSMSVVAHEEYTVHATVGDYSGDLYIKINYRDVDPKTDPVIKGSWVITGGTEELSNLQGQGTLNWYYDSNNVPVHEFIGQVHFDP